MFRGMRTVEIDPLVSIESESGHDFLDTLTRYYEEKEDVTIEDFVTKINELIKEKTKLWRCFYDAE